jgi:K(+)-stimulated pyrophosphate-energized sodium pump
MNPNIALWLSLGAALLAVIYGFVTVSWVLKQPAGNGRMEEIAGAVQ